MLNLDACDKKILSQLKKEAGYPSILAKQIGISRTTLTYRLIRLRKLGVVNRSIVGRKSVYELNFSEPDSKQSIKIYSGKEILNAYWKLTRLPKESLILQVQGRDAAKSAFENLPDYFIKKIHLAFKRRKMILKCLSNQESLTNFDSISKSLVESHIGRTFGVKILSNKFFADGEIISADKLLLLTNPGKSKAIIIKDKGISKIVHDLLKLAFELLDSDPAFNLGAFLKNKYSSNKTL